ncbi:alkaline phosphatase [Dysgonomonas sp. 511]|uniref:alkaline phosphatase n=1 Tax=Dysgonomonas sp. 511 TaxID=2302930 RepID=UPI0013D71BAC|nr:alkaline phosphatase [Dysgonomonas sp. 511]NDV78186.1 alkaline phosphatase [Dysgonomonas sp. 511]
MMKRVYLCILLQLFLVSIFAQQNCRKSVRPVKNVIFMVSDGTSTSLLSIARWFQYYNGGTNSGSDKLNIDPYLCGLVNTYCSNAPVPDSAPAMSAYMTGIPAQKGNISVYPQVDALQDIYPTDPAMALRPAATVMEAAKIEKGKATGVAVTCEFPHATPAACASHYYDRGKYEYIAPQMAYNNLDVVFGGGYDEVTAGMKDYFAKTGVKYIKGDIDAFRSFSGDEKVWALFSPSRMPYDIDREAMYPSLAEMTGKAIARLDKAQEGFFLMVEGSRVDMAAHSNDPIGAITEFLAFDKAVGVALDYAKKNGETAVVVLADHGTADMNFGSEKFKGSSAKGLDSVFFNVSKYKLTAEGLEKVLLKTKPEAIKPTFNKYTGIDLSEDEVNQLLSSKNYKASDYTQIASSVNMVSTIAKIMVSRTYFDFISGRHTGEDVFLAAYHPQGDIPLGLRSNVEINKYLCDLVGLEKSLAELSSELYARHTDVFNGYDYKIAKENDNIVLTVKKGKTTMKIPAFTSVGYLNGKPFNLGSVAVYIDKNEQFYLPAHLTETMEMLN